MIVAIMTTALAGTVKADTSTLTFTAACGGSGTADDGVEWTVTSDGTESNFETDRGIHYGTGNAAVQYITLTTSQISGTITKIVVNASGNNSPTLSVTVGGNDFGDAATNLTTANTAYTFEGSASGTIVVDLRKSSSAKKALYVKSVEVTYTPAGSSAVATTTTINTSGITNRDVYTSTAAGSLAAIVKDANNNVISDAAVTWSSSNENVATVASNGTVTLVAAGTTNITASYAGVANEYQASSDTYELTVTSSAPVETIVFSELGYENADDITVVDGTDVTLTFGAGTNTQNSPKYYTTGSAARMYNGNTLTIASEKKIASIEFTFDGNNTTLALASGQTGTLSDAENSIRTWTGSSNSIVFTTTATNRIKKIEITYENENLSDPELSYATTAYTVEGGSSFATPSLVNPHNLTVTYSSSNPDIATVNAETGAVTIGNTPGTVTITATFEGNDTYSYGSASYTITVEVVLQGLAALTELTAEGDYVVRLTDALVTYVHGTNAYIQDASGAVILYGCAGTFAAGDKISGKADVHYKVFNNLPEVTSITLEEGYTKTTGNTIEPEVVTIETLNANFTNYISRYVKIVEATVTSAFSNRNSTISQNGNSIVLRDQNNPGTLVTTVDDIVTVTAHPTIFNTSNQISVYEQSQIVVKEVEKTDPTILVEDATIAFGQTYTIDSDLIEGGDVTVSVSPEGFAIVNGLTITPSKAGSATVTVSTAESNLYNAGSETFTLTVTQPAGQTEAPSATTGEVVFYESFAASTGSITTFSDNDGNGTFTPDNADAWSTANAYGAGGAAKFGASKKKGSAEATISVTSGVTYTLTFKAAPWASEASTMSVVVTGGTISGLSTDPMTTGQWNDFSATITATSTTLGVEFSASNNRFFLDDVKVEAPASGAPTETYTIPSSGLGTYCSQYPINLDELPEGVKAYAVTAKGESSVTLTEITGTIKGGVGFILEGSGEVTFTFADSSTEPTNLLVGTLAPEYLAKGTAYGLKSGVFQPNTAGTIKAHRAYLPADAGNAVKALTLIFEDDATGITHTRVITDEATIYDLTGRRLSQMQKGINIVNGKKILK